MRSWVSVAVWLAVCSFAHCPAAACGQVPRAVVMLCDGLSVDDLRNPALPNLNALARRGQVALMNAATGGGPAEQASWLALATGALAPAGPTDLDLYPASFAPIERASAAVVFRRRTGIAPPDRSLVHLGIAPLARRELNERLVGAVLAGNNLRPLAACGLESRRSALFTVDARGIGPEGFFTNDLEALARWISRQTGGVVVDLGGNDAGKRAVDALLARIASSRQNLNSTVLLLSPRSPSPDRLPVAVLAGAGIEPGTLTSATTRTPGLIANIDIAPTILSMSGVPVPASMTGHPIVPQDRGDAVSEVARLDTRITLNQRALTPVGLFLAGLGAAALAGGLISLRFAPRAAPLFGSLILAFLNMPLAMLAASLAPVSTVPALGATVLALMAALTILEKALCRRTVFSDPCMLAGLATVAVIAADALVGQPMVKFSLISGYQIQGIRFYGIGNEYMGFAIGFSLLAVFLSGIRARAAAVIFAAVAFVIGFPRLGANAGGMIAAAVAFGCGYRAIRGREPRWIDAAVWAAAGFAAALGLALLDRWMPGGYGSPSHIGGAMQSAGSRGYGVLWEIVQRKALMNARIVQTPAVVASVIVFAGLAWLFAERLRDHTRAITGGHPGWTRGLQPAGWGALAAFVFNDSGIVAALFILGPFIAAGLYYMLTEAVVDAAPLTPASKAMTTNSR